METFDYELDRTAWLYTLRISVETQVEEKAKMQFISVISSGKNAAKGKLFRKKSLNS